MGEGIRHDFQRTIAAVVGGVLTILGLLGFFAAGRLLVFDVNTLHNFVHLFSGIPGLAAAAYGGRRWSVVYNRGFGWLFLVLFLLTVIFPGVMEMLLNVNTADNYLHITLGVLLLGVGYGVVSRHR